MRLSLLLLAALLSACGLMRSQPAPEPRVIVREVKVAVPTDRQPPAQLRSCGSSPPGFQFRESGNPEAPIALSAADAGRLRRWVDSAHRCIGAWRAWATN